MSVRGSLNRDIMIFTTTNNFGTCSDDENGERPVGRRFTDD
jgi:hypothetical protein